MQDTAAHIARRLEQRPTVPPENVQSGEGRVPHRFEATRDNNFGFQQLRHDPAGARTQDLPVKKFPAGFVVIVKVRVGMRGIEMAAMAVSVV